MTQESLSPDPIRGSIRRAIFRNSLPIPTLIFTAFFQHQIIVFVHKSQMQFFSYTFRHFECLCLVRLDDATATPAIWPIVFRLSIDERGPWWVQSPIWGIGSLSSFSHANFFSPPPPPPLKNPWSLTCKRLSFSIFDFTGLHFNSTPLFNQGWLLCWDVLVKRLTIF